MENAPSKGSKTKKQPQDSLPAHKNDQGAESCIVGRQRNLQNFVGVRISLDPGAIPQVRHHTDPVGGDREVAGLAAPRPTP